MAAIEIVGRSSSHYTRVARIFALELGVPHTFVPIHDLMGMDATLFAGHPALKLPTLRRADGSLVFGTENICRVIAERAGAAKRVVWPEELRSDISRNAQELVWHAMAAQVQLVLGTGIGKLPADNMYFAKARAGFEGALRWLDEHLAAALDALPPARDASLFEVTLFCLVEHLAFRVTVPIAPYAALRAFAAELQRKSSALSTQYRFDPPPEPR